MLSLGIIKSLENNDQIHTWQSIMDSCEPKMPKQKKGKCITNTKTFKIATLRDAEIINSQ